MSFNTTPCFEVIKKERKKKKLSRTPGNESRVGWEAIVGQSNASLPLAPPLPTKCARIWNGHDS